MCYLLTPLQSVEASTEVWELACQTNFPCPDKVSLIPDPHEDDANIHVPASDRTGDACVHLVTSPDHHSVYLVRVVWRTVDQPQPSLPLDGDVYIPKIYFGGTLHCFCLLSNAVVKKSVAMKCLPVTCHGIQMEVMSRALI